MFWNASARAGIKQEGIGKQFLPEQDVINLRFLKGSRRNQIIGAVVAGSLAACVSGHFNKTNIVSWQNLGVILATGFFANVSSANIENYRLKTRRKKIEDAANNHVDKIFKPLSDLGTYSTKDLLSVVRNFMEEKERLEPHSEQPYVVRFNLAGTEKIEHIFFGQFADRLAIKVEVSDFLDKLKQAKLSDSSEQQSELSQCREILSRPGFVNEIAKDVFCQMDIGSRPLFTAAASVINNDDVFSQVQEPLYQILQNSLITLSFLSNETDQKAFVKSQEQEIDSVKYGGHRINGLARYHADRFVNLVNEIPLFKQRFEEDFGQENFGRILDTIRWERDFAEDLCALIDRWSENRANRSGSEMANGTGSLPPVISAIRLPGEQAR